MLRNRIIRANILLILMVVFVLSPHEIAKADIWNYDYTVEAYGYYPNESAFSYPFITADTQHRLGREISVVRLSWEIKAGDTIQMLFYDKKDVEMAPVKVTSSSLSARKFAVTAPKGACTGQVELMAGNDTGSRQVWIKEFDATSYGDYWGQPFCRPRDHRRSSRSTRPPDPPDPGSTSI